MFAETKEVAYSDQMNKLPSVAAQRKVKQGGQQADKKLGKKNQPSKESIKPYEEEESYENPVNISKAAGC